jgi:hypothetical protein
MQALKDLGSKIESGVVTAAKAVKDLPQNIGFEGDFDRIKSLNQIARTQNVRAKKYSAQEWADAEKRADAVLDSIYHGYTEEGFDPVRYELEQLSTDAGHEEIEATVEKLTTGVEVRAHMHAGHLLACDEEAGTSFKHASNVGMDERREGQPTRACMHACMAANLLPCMHAPVRERRRQRASSPATCSRSVMCCSRASRP